MKLHSHNIPLGLTIREGDISQDQHVWQCSILHEIEADSRLSVMASI